VGSKDQRHSLDFAVLTKELLRLTNFLKAKDIFKIIETHVAYQHTYSNFLDQNTL